MQRIKKILYTLLSERQYLRILHRSFYLLFDLGLLKNDKRFKFHYAVKKLIQPEYTVVDIGANLGYFSRNSIEPVPQFFDVLDSFMKRYNNSVRYNVALGNEEGTITMVLPKSNGMIRTGLPHIAENEEEQKQHDTKEVKIVKGSELLGTLDCIDYIKCDIEGYELNVFKEILPLLDRHKPIVQIEIAPKNLDEMCQLFAELNFIQFGIVEGKIVQENTTQQEEGDYIFVHKSKADLLIA
jgi:FkbM family methyltransferase